MCRPGRVVVAEDGEVLAFADGGLRDVRHQVVRHAARKLADQSGRMRPIGLKYLSAMPLTFEYAFTESRRMSSHICFVLP